MTHNLHPIPNQPDVLFATNECQLAQRHDLFGPLLAFCLPQEAWDPPQLEREQINHRQLIDELDPGSITRKEQLQIREDEQYTKCVCETRVKLRDLPSCHPRPQWIVPTKGSPKIMTIHNHVRERVHESTISATHRSARAQTVL